jgi:LacI family repressor for deo operon, udp, cdd, tsx, nupC, and nupG
MVRVSIKDIARQAGVSHSTVSRALSDSPLVNTRTKARIRRLAGEMGYSPDAQARSLVKGRTLTFGVVVTTISDPFIAEVVQSIESTAHDHGYSVILASSNSEPKREIAAVAMLRSKRVDGVIVTSSRVGAVYLEHLERIGAPVVLINNNREDSGPYTFSITVDNRHGGRLATQHLLEGGHKRIAYITGRDDHSSDAGRREGYCEALEAAGIGFDQALIQPGNGRSDGGQRALPALLELEDRPTAVFCYNDMTAIGLILAARQSGLRMPADLAVVGFDDIPIASFACPPLTTIAQPKHEMGKRAVEMALELLDPAEGGEPMTNIVFKGRLVVRESSGSLSAGRDGG